MGYDIFSDLLGPTSLANEPFRDQMIEAVESGDLSQTVLRLHQMLISDTVTWSGEAIRSFVRTIFHHYGVVPPSEDVIAALCDHCDMVRPDGMMDVSRCVVFVDAIFRSIFERTPKDGWLRDNATRHGTDNGIVCTAAQVGPMSE